MIRAGALLLALLQFGASTAVVAADAILDGEQTTHPAHVESQGGEDCAQHHDHMFCQIVRTLASATQGRAVQKVHTEAPVYTRWAVQHEGQAHRASIEFGAAGPRAPPLA